MFRSTLEFLQDLIRCQGPRLWFWWGLTVLLGFSEGVGLIFLAPVLHFLQLTEPGSVSFQIVHTLDRWIAGIGGQLTLGVALFGYVLGMGMYSGIQYVQATLRARMGQRFLVYFRSRLYRAVARMDWLSFTRQVRGDIVQILTTEMDRIGIAVWHLLHTVVSAMMAAVYLVFAGLISLPMTVGVLSTGILLGPVLHLGLRRSRRWGDQWVDAYRQVHRVIQAHLDGMKLIHSYGLQEQHVRYFERTIQRMGEIYERVTRWHRGIAIGIMWGSALLVAILLYTGLAIFRLPRADVLILVYLFFRLLPRGFAIYQGLQEWVHHLPSYTEVRRVEQWALRHAVFTGQADPMPPLSRSIRLEAVTFGYRQEQPVIHDLSIEIPAGQITAIVGHSGAGKTTVVDIIMGLLRPWTGTVWIDGIPLTERTCRSWQQQIGYVPQDPVLFHDTIRANLLWARPDATEDELWQALEAAGADFVRRLPEGLDTRVGDRGIRLAGGERQRIALAQALVRRPRCLILDEFTSALDSLTETRILDTIQRLRGTTTIVMVTHRIPSVRIADRIYVLMNGRVMETGTWTELTGRSHSRFAGMLQQFLPEVTKEK